MKEVLQYEPSSWYEELRRRAHVKIGHIYIWRELYSCGREPVRYNLDCAIPAFEVLDDVVASGNTGPELDIIYGSTLNALNEAAFLRIFE
jgi:hypothetical protein